MISEIISSMLISVVEVSAVIAFLLLIDPQAYQHKPIRILYSLLFFLANYASQHLLHKAYFNFIQYATPINLLLILSTIAVYTVFLLLWTEEGFKHALFFGNMFALINNLTWSIFGKLSQTFFGSVTLNSGIYTYPKLLLMFVVEMLVVLLIANLLSPYHHVQINTGVLLLNLSAGCCYYYIELKSVGSELIGLDTEIIPAILALISIILIVYTAARNSKEAELLFQLKTEALLAEQQVQFQQQLINIENVNRTYHDMKNMLLAVKTQKSESVNEMLQALQPYETNISTGNETIDIILTEKLSLCYEKEITCTPMIDGIALGFVSPLDLCVIFGNALDNAIEACTTIDNVQLRNITVSTRHAANSAVIVFRNTCLNAPRIAAGLPRTTKEDKEKHGYGLSSIQMIAEKYNGHIICSIENQEFVLTILLMDDTE